MYVLIQCITCNKAVLCPYNCSSKTPMNTARRRRQAGRQAPGRSLAGNTSGAILHAAPTVLAMHPKDFRLSAISGLCGLQINLFVHIDSGFFSAVAFGWHWAAAWLWCPPACASPVCRLEDVHSRRMDATGRMMFRGRLSDSNQGTVVIVDSRGCRFNSRTWLYVYT